ncbi:MAG: hypothetical protein Sapg2KO_53490 [Saprospiraceae bacterium]
MKNITELIKEIDSKVQKYNIDNALDLLIPFDEYSGDDWQNYFDTTVTEFQYLVLHEDLNFKLVLIHWDKGSSSKKHGHMKGGGLIKVLFGQISETRFHPDNLDLETGKYSYTTGDLSYIHDAIGLHIVENTQQNHAISLHLYCHGKNSTFGLVDEAMLVKTQ